MEKKLYKKIDAKEEKKEKEEKRRRQTQRRRYTPMNLCSKLFHQFKDFLV
jgi:hypothetical protein